MILKRFDSSKSRLFKSLSEKPIYIFPQKNRGKKNEEKEGKEKKKKRKLSKRPPCTAACIFNRIQFDIAGKLEGKRVSISMRNTRERERERPSLECYNERPAISGCRSKKGQMYKRSVEGI